MTTTIPDHILHQARATDLIALAERYGVALKKESPVSRCGPCPACGGGEDRFWVRDNRYKCRVCGISGDSIAFVTLKERCTFVEAVSMLTGYQTSTRPAPAQPVRQLSNLPPAPPTPKRQPPNEQKVAEFTRIADAANHALFTDSSAEPGREYLISRGINPRSWQQFHLGYRPDVPLPGTWDADKRCYTQAKHPAIAMPWYRSGKVQGIRYRFLRLHQYPNVDNKPAKAKQTAQPGSYFEDGVYGAHALPSWTWEAVENSEGRRSENYCTLVICEGELNAISIWQTCNDWNWEVLSLGSESAHVPQKVIDDYAVHFERVLVWMDRPDRAREEMARIGPLVYAVNSVPLKDEQGRPILHGNGKPKQKDANDLLQAEQLGGYLAEVRKRACRSDEERRRFLYSLQWADEGPPFLDEGTRSVMRGMLK